MNKTNIIFLGTFPYPYGMAGTKRIQHVIDGLRTFEGISVRVIVLRQSSADNSLSGVFNEIPFETVMPDLFRMKFLLLAPIFFVKAMSAIRRAFEPGSKNILYVYGSPEIDNMLVVRYARKLGFKIVFDMVEDYDTATGISSSFYYRLKIFYTCHLTSQITKFADGLIVISSHLMKKFSDIAAGLIPIYLHPISVEFENFELPLSVEKNSKSTTLFYSGSFGVKDGVTDLIDAFELLASRHADIRLVLTGKGSSEDMQEVLRRIACSYYVNRIENKGYLVDKEYYATLRSVDIPCMTRVDLAYAHAGFPFKLGEYLATGKPVVASSVSDVSHFLKDRHSAFFVKPGSPEDIVNAIECILRYPEEATEIGARGRNVARESFDYKLQASALHSFLVNL